ncbi:MAG TPA: hypothetical protein VKM54_15545, partial [Myxococcota bacterium]|nr:hypothetical protein [Myxococcota bacterium]
METTEHLRAVATRLESSANVVGAEAALAEDGRRLQTGVADTNAVLELVQRFSVLNDLAQAWTEARQHLVALVARTTAHTSDCSAALDEIQKLRDVWTRTGEAARVQNAPEELIQRVDATLSDLQRTHERIMALRDRLLALQSEATRHLGVCDEVLARLEQSRHEEEKEFGERTGMPLWRAAPAEYEHGALLRPVLRESRIELRLAAGYIQRHQSLLFLPLFLFPTLILLMRHARNRVEHWIDSGPEIHEHLAVLELPYSVALLVTVFSVYALHPDAPRLLVDVIATILVVPVLR